jgi:hypothetical protein
MVHTVSLCLRLHLRGISCVDITLHLSVKSVNPAQIAEVKLRRCSAQSWLPVLNSMQHVALINSFDAINALHGTESMHCDSALKRSVGG